MLDIIRVPLVVLMLLYGSFVDIKTREISDILWIIPGSIAIMLNIYEIWLGFLSVTTLLISVGFSVIFGLMTIYLGLFGEADALALLDIALLSPVPPNFFIGGGLKPLLMPLSVLSNSVLLAASLAALVLVRNLLDRGKGLFAGYGSVSWITKTVLLFSGRRIRIDKVRGPPYEYPLERIDEGKVTLMLRPDIKDDESAVKVLSELSSAGEEYVWVSYSIPFLVALLFGYLFAVFYGDIIFTLMWKLL